MPARSIAFRGRSHCEHVRQQVCTTWGPTQVSGPGPGHCMGLFELVGAKRRSCSTCLIRQRPSSDIACAGPLTASTVAEPMSKALLRGHIHLKQVPLPTPRMQAATSTLLRPHRSTLQMTHIPHLGPLKVTRDGAHGLPSGARPASRLRTPQPTRNEVLGVACSFLSTTTGPSSPRFWTCRPVLAIALLVALPLASATASSVTPPGEKLPSGDYVSFDEFGTPFRAPVFPDIDQAADAVEFSVLKPRLPTAAPSPKISPSLLLSTGEYVDVLVAVRRDSLPPKLSGEGEPLTPAMSPVAQASLLQFSAQRHAEQQDVVEAIEASDGWVYQQFVLGNIIAARVPRWTLSGLSSFEEVIHIMPRFISSSPPDASGQPNGDTADDVEDARALINSDPYFAQFGTHLRVGLIDSGVYPYQSMLDGRIGRARDCICGGLDCENINNPQCPFNSGDHSPNTGHGTKSASIISGSAIQGQRYRGVTAATIDTWAIDHGDVLTMIKAVERAVFWGNTVVVAELQPEESPVSALSAAFDDAFDAGATVVAAVGNGAYEGPSCSGPPLAGSVRSPANAHKVLAVGYYNVKAPNEGVMCDSTACDNAPTSGDTAHQSRGPAPDGRIKPDILMPTRTETGCALSGNCISTYCHSSGATPYAGGASLLLYNFYNANGFAPSPGKIYVTLIGFGDRPFPLFDNLSGSGRVRLGDLTSTTWHVGTKYVAGQEYQDMAFYVAGGSTCDLKAAIWWPEDTVVVRNGMVDGAHNDIDLYITDSSGQIVGESTSQYSVFEKVNIADTLSTTGYWRFRIHGYSNPGGPQKVYYFLYYRTAGC